MSSQSRSYAETYTSAVEEAISFSRLPLAYFTKAKARHLLEVARRHLGDPRSLTALDVGCGVGLTDRLLAPELGSLHGVDLSAEALDAARAENPGVDYRLGDGRDLPFGDRAFDLVFAVNVVQLLPRGEELHFLAGMRRVVRGGGLVVVFEHNPLNPATRLVVRRHGAVERGRLLSRRRLRALFEAARLDVVESKYVVLLPAEGDRVVRLERALGGAPLGAQYYVAGRRR
jgi:SAM-dependent methyltransferase